MQICNKVHCSPDIRKTMARIAITDGMSEDAQKNLMSLGHELHLNSFSTDELEGGVLRDFDAVIIRSATKLTSRVIQASAENGGNLRVVGRAGVGVDNIDINAATTSGVLVVNAPRSSTQSVVELTLGHLLSCARKIPSADRSMRSGKWEKKSFTGSELS